MEIKNAKVIIEITDILRDLCDGNSIKMIGYLEIIKAMIIKQGENPFDKFMKKMIASMDKDDM